ncbi:MULTISPECIES: 2-hydroxymuconate tautomerase [Alteribacter]|uniref:Tautomerase n=1 Tax=Alteribacter keqinensis TaxID=2483800 RepID=A0A3M7TPJ8_9BACI|nr:2-hydroxymuconate tautomerase [Alteribacter keqinensis]MBM7095331.1 2-hydroxymuconate tautomerase family protein [Alteribacter salitolerans]RNA67076.1 4-oxalocrotonate tautomerase [Alteribacter keqinensis]
MPIAHIHILEGRSREQKQHLIQDITTAISENLDVPGERVKVLLHEMPHENWGSNGISKAAEMKEST